MLWLLWIIIAISVLAILFAAYTSAKILKQPEGTDKMKEISKAVHEGAMAFLHKEYRTLAIFIERSKVCLIFGTWNLIVNWDLKIENFYCSIGNFSPAD